MNKQIKFDWLQSKDLRRLVAVLVATAIATQSVLTIAAPTPYRQQVDHFLGALKADSVWDQRTGDEPGEISRRWAEALQKHQDQMFANGLSDIERADHFDLWIESLRNNAFFGQSANPEAKYYANHPLDVYGLLGQTVHTKAVETRFSKLKRVISPVTKTVKAAAAVTNRAMKGVGEAVASMMLGGAALSASVDEARGVTEKDEPQVRHRPYFDAINLKRLGIQVVDSEGRVVRVLNPVGADLSRVFAAGAGEGETSYHISQGAGKGPFTFRLAYQGQVLNEFQNNVTAVTAFDRYLVFIEPGKTNREQGIVNLSFVDLEFFNSAVGRTVLPIFRLPVKVGHDGVANVEKLILEATSKGLRVEDKFVTEEVFEFFSQMQQMAFNTTVSLVDDNFYASTSKLLGSLLEQFNQSLDQTAQDLNQQMERAGVTFDLYRQFRNDLNTQLKLRSEVKPAGKTAREIERTHGRLAVEAVRKFDQEVGITSNSEQALEMLTQDRVARAENMANAISKDVKGHLQKVQRFGEQLAADQAFQKTMQGYGQAISATRKLSNRVNAFWARMVMPQPLGAPKVQQALGLVAAGVTSKDAWSAGAKQMCAITKEGLAELVANRRSRMALEVLTGAALCSLYPAETAQFAYHSLDVARNMSTAFLGWVDNWGHITQTAWKASWSWLDMGLIYETYFAKDRFHKLAVGVGALYGTLLATAGMSHVVVNGYRYGKTMGKIDWPTYRREGQGFMSHLKAAWKMAKESGSAVKQSFVGYVNQDRRSYYAALARADKKRRGQDLRFVTPEGKDFRGLFRTGQINDLKVISDAERNGEKYDIAIALPDGRELKGRAVVGTQVPGRVFMEMDMPDGTKVSRVIEPVEGDWNLIGDDTATVDGTVAEFKLQEKSLVGAMQNTEWTDEEEKMLATLMEEIERKDQLAAKRLNTLASLPFYALGVPAQINLKNGSDKDIETLGKAIRHFLVGYSSWTHTTRFFGKLWNPWFLLRNFWVKPRTWFTMMAYPNVFNRMVWNGGIATNFDGGKKTLGDLGFMQKMVSLATLGPYIETVTELSAIEKFEKEIIPVEKSIHEAAMRQAFLNVVKVAAQDPDLMKLLSEGGRVHPFDDKFKRLNKKVRIYFEAYFGKLFEDSLRTHLMTRMGFDPARPMADEVIKKAATAYEGSFALTDDQADELVRRVATENSVATHAREIAEGGLKSMGQRLKLAHWRKVAKAMNPDFNGSLARYTLAEKQMNNEEAMARATRQYMVGLVVDKPVEMLFTFLFLAGIDEGVLKPLHDEAFGPDSAYYLSRYVFWNGYFVGIMISLLADVWMKIQQDARVDNLGGFNHVPSAEEYKKGYMSYYRKNFFSDDNKWWDNQKYELTLAFVNMPAYFVTAMVSNLLTLGRFDMDSFLAVYKGSLLPTGGLGFKLENAFEMSGNYVIGSIPSKFHSDPRVQEIRNSRLGALRFKYNVLYKTFYENPLGNLLGNWMTMPVQGIGPRAWIRQFWGGYLPTEVLVNNVVRPVQAWQGDSLLKSVANGCDTLLTTNHTDAVKLLPKVSK
ncbi:MAG: hypothetical protein AB7N80_06650 [Bdellovibrionales bacterium]